VVHPDPSSDPLTRSIDVRPPSPNVPCRPWSAGFEIRDVESLREHDTKTLQAWVSNLEENWDAAVNAKGHSGMPPTRSGWH